MNKIIKMINMEKKRKYILIFLGLFLLISAYVEAKVRTQVIRNSPVPERNVGIIPEARSVEDWARVRTQVIKETERRNRQIETSQNLPDKMEDSRRETEEERLKSAYKIEKDAREMKQKIEQASPNEVVGENPDGTKWYQYSGRFDIFKNWIKNKLKELGLLDKWKGESFEELVQKYGKTNFDLTFNKKSWSYFGKRSSTLQTTEFQFSLTNPEDNFEKYIQTRSRQLIWDSANNREAEIVQHTITDEIEWAGKFYGTPGKTEQGRQMLSSRQRTWDETRGTYSEVNQRNVYEGNFHMPIKTIRKVFESGYDTKGNYYERRYEMTRENIEWAWVVSSDPISGGSYETKSFDQTMIDYSTPDKKTISHHEFTYTDDGVPESQLIVSREVGLGLNHISVSLERYLDYYKDGSLRQGLSLDLTGDFPDVYTAVKEGRTLQNLINNKETKSQIEAQLGRSLNLNNPQDLKIYTAYLREGLGETARKISLSFAEKKHNDKAFLAWEKETVAIEGKDENGSLISSSSEIEKTYTQFLPFGQPTEIEQLIRSEATPNVETKLKISLKYNKYCQVTEQRTETRETSLDGKLNKHTISIKDKIVYNGLGQEISYREREEEYDIDGKRIGNRETLVKNITYNEDGLQTGYEMQSITRGIDTHDGSIFEIITETKVRDIRYNELDMRISWKEISIDLSRSPGLISERMYQVKAIDEFGRITEIDIKEHTYGTASDGTSLNTERTINRKIKYNSLGQEEEAIEEVIEKAKTTISTIKYAYDQYGRISREERKVHVTGKDGDSELDYTYTLLRYGFEYNDAGLLQRYKAKIRNESTADIEITQEVEIGYDSLGRVDYQKTQVWEDTRSGDKALHKYTLTVRENITYNELGLETAYTETEEEFDEDGKRIGNRKVKVSNITYNEDGLQTGYDMAVIVEGTDTHDGSSFETFTEIKVRDIRYNNLGIRISWRETTIDTSRSPGLTTERKYAVTEIDRFGRPIELIINEHAYGSASDGTSLDTFRKITRQITYNSLGQEEEITETVEEGAKKTTSKIKYEYDECGRIKYEERNIHVEGEEEGVELDYISTIRRYGFKYNDAGLVQGYTAEIWNESSPDLEIKQEVEFGYDSLGRIDYQRSETWEKGISKKRDKHGEPTGEEEEVERHTISEKYDIQYNELGLETYYKTDRKEYEDGELIRDVTETTSGIRYDSKGRMTEYTTHRTGQERFLEDSGEYGELKSVNITTHIYNITYVDGLDLRKSWREEISGYIGGQEFKASTRQYEILEFDRFGEVVDINIEGDGVEEENSAPQIDTRGTTSGPEVNQTTRPYSPTGSIKTTSVRRGPVRGLGVRGKSRTYAKRPSGISLLSSESSQRKKLEEEAEYITPDKEEEK
ncbi:MAG: hypothetical protein NC818_00260 [Candidatus Omnitrophica bacterium]|nr:hypothetical protein [Candidatus Omnitrophota bacterium]